jgi:hypothetical protein
MPSDVLEKTQSRCIFANRLSDSRPQVARIVGHASLPGRAERLAWVSADEQAEAFAA